MEINDLLDYLNELKISVNNAESYYEEKLYDGDYECEIHKYYYEGYSSGIDRIIEAIKSNNLNVPLFESYNTPDLVD